MEYSLSVLGELKDRKLEDAFMAGETQKAKKLIRYVVLLSSLGNFLFIIPDYLYLSWTATALWIDIAVRAVIVIVAVFIFVFTKRLKNVKSLGLLTGGFGLFIYGAHLFIASFFVPVHLLFETLSLALLSTSLFLMPNRWIVNLLFSIAFFVLYAVSIPFLCTASELGERVIAMAYGGWNIIVLGILFYRINIHKRNHFAKEIQLEELANTDHLTKIHNRKACESILEIACQTHDITSCVMFDIDNFKHINDTFGHLAGDHVIVNIVTAVKLIIRKGDILARWGGEEFVLVLPGSNLAEATELAKRVREQIALIKHDGIRQGVTCSFGVTALKSEDTSRTVVGRADQLLYLAKEYGRNRVVSG